jgi:hypothetical protein
MPELVFRWLATWELRAREALSAQPPPEPQEIVSGPEPEAYADEPACAPWRQ